MINRRAFLMSGAALAAPGAMPAAGQKRKDWFRRQARVFLLDFQMPDPVDQGAPGMPHFFQKLDPPAIVEQVAAAGGNVLLVHAKCNQGNCYYNTKVGHKHSDLGDRDLIAELSALCRKRGLTILYYVQLSRERRSFEHPERRAIDSTGEPVIKMNDNPLLAAREEAPVVCMNGPHRQFIKDILAELIRGYDFDGFWLDCFNWWGKVNPCCCDFCKAAYKRDTGAGIPTKQIYTTAEGKRYIAWRRRLNTTILKDIVGTVRAINPALTVTHNASGENPWSEWEFCDGDDYVSHEYHFSEGYAQLSLLCQRNWSLKPGVPFEIEIWRFANRHGGQHHSMRAYQVRRPEVLLTEMATVSANGGFPQYYDQVRPDGTLEPRSMNMLTPAFRDAAARQPWCGVGEPVGYAAVLWSKSTEALAPPEVQTLSRESITGAFTALMENHLPVAVMTERDLAARQWRGAKVIVVDSAECLSVECCQALDAYVQAGGGLVVAGRSSLRDGEGKVLENFGLCTLIGADYQGMTTKWYSFITPEQAHPVTEGLELSFPMSVYASLQTTVKPHAGAKALGAITNPMPGFHMGYPPLERTRNPSVLIHEHGKGRVVYISAALGALYSRANHPDYRRLMVNAVQWAAGGAPPVTADAPGTVEMVAWRDESSRRTIVHLVNRTGVGLPQGEGQFQQEIIPVHGLRVHVDGPLAGSTAKAQPGARILPCKRTGSRMTVNIDRLEIWEVIEIA
jgi:type 1 glutamine amidotransferase